MHDRCTIFAAFRIRFRTSRHSAPEYREQNIYVRTYDCVELLLYIIIIII